LPGQVELAVMGGRKLQKSSAQIEASSLSQKEKSLMKPKKLNYSQKRDTTNRFHLIMPHQDYGQMLLLIR
jgi:hypothetical protein